MRPLALLICALAMIPVAHAALLQDQEETILGRPSTIRPAPESAETVSLTTGVAIREQPWFESPVLEILTAPMDLPVLDRRGGWVKVRYGTWQGWVALDAQHRPTDALAVVPMGPDDERLRRARGILEDDPELRSCGPFQLYTDVRDEDQVKAMIDAAVSVELK